MSKIPSTSILIKFGRWLVFQIKFRLIKYTFKTNVSWKFYFEWFYSYKIIFFLLIQYKIKNNNLKNNLKNWWKTPKHVFTVWLVLLIEQNLSQNKSSGSSTISKIETLGLIPRKSNISKNLWNHKCASIKLNWYNTNKWSMD